MNEQISGLLGNSMKGLRELIDVDSVVGKPINLADGTVIIPVSKVSFGFGSGGSDVAVSSPKEAFGGGGAGGVTIHPLCFLIIKDGDVRMVNVVESKNTTDRIVNMIPGVVDKISDMIAKKGDEKTSDKTGTEKETVTKTSV